MDEGIVQETQDLKVVQERPPGVFPDCSHRELGLSVENWCKGASVVKSQDLHLMRTMNTVMVESSDTLKT